LGHPAATLSVKMGAEEAEFAELLDQCLGKVPRGCAFRDGMISFVDELASGLADKFSSSLSLRIKVEMNRQPGKRGHERFLRPGKRATQEV